MISAIPSARSSSRRDQRSAGASARPASSADSGSSSSGSRRTRNPAPRSASAAARSSSAARERGWGLATTVTTVRIGSSSCVRPGSGRNGRGGDRSAGETALGADAGEVHEAAAGQPGTGHPGSRATPANPVNPVPPDGKRGWRSRPVSRILFPAISRSSGRRPSISACRRRQAPAAYPQARAGNPRTPAQTPWRPLGLAPGGVYLAAPVTRGAGGLLHHRFTLARPANRSGGLFSVALSRGSPRVAVSNHPALWSPDFPRRGLPRRGRPADSSTGSSLAIAGARPTRPGLRGSGHFRRRRTGSLVTARAAT